MTWIDYLPHQPPMRLLQEVVDVTPGERAVGRRLTDPSDFYFQGHFPGHPIVPAVILIEMLAQTGGIAAAAPAEGTSPQPLQLRVAANRTLQVSERGARRNDARGTRSSGWKTWRHVQRSKATLPQMAPSSRPGA